MSTNIIAAIDMEIERLQRVRAMLAETPDTTNKATDALPGKRRGRPAGTKNLNSFISPLNPTIKKRARSAGSGKSAPVSEPVKAKRMMSEEGKAKIAAAQKKRWASAKRAAKKAGREAESIETAKKTTKPAPAKKAVAKKAPAKKDGPTKAPRAKKVTATKAVPTKAPAAKKVTAKKAVVKTPPAKSAPAPTTEAQAPLAA